MPDRDDQPRWPRGTPWQERGPGPGRFRDSPGWAGRVARRMGRSSVSSYAGRDDFEVTGTAGGSQGQVEFRRYSDGRWLAQKRYAAFGSIAARWAEREVEVARVAHAIGAAVPETVRDDESSILMDYIDGRTASLLLLNSSDLDRLDPDGMRWLALLDMLVGNGDRHSGNLMVDQDGRVWGIDHAFAFGSDWFQPSGQGYGEELTAPHLLLGYYRLILEEVYDDDPDRGRAVVGWEQVGFTHQELEQVRQRLLGIDGLDSNHLGGMLRVLDLLVDMTP